MRVNQPGACDGWPDAALFQDESDRSTRQAAFDAAINHIKTTTAAVADAWPTTWAFWPRHPHASSKRDILVGAQLDLRRNMSTFVLVFGDTSASESRASSIPTASRAASSPKPTGNR